MGDELATMLIVQHDSGRNINIFKGFLLQHLKCNKSLNNHKCQKPASDRLKTTTSSIPRQCRVHGEQLNIILEETFWCKRKNKAVHKVTWYFKYLNIVVDNIVKKTNGRGKGLGRGGWERGNNPQGQLVPCENID